MAAPTPIVGLHQYDSGQDLDYNDINADNQLIDLLPQTVCTSTTRPVSNLFTGRKIYETDTGRIFMWVSGQWLFYGSIPLSLIRRRTTTLAVANGAFAPFDNFQTFVGGFNTSHFTHAAGVFTVLRPGMYQWSITGEWQAVAQTGSGVGRRRFLVYVNGVSAYEGIWDDMPDNGQSLNSGDRQTATGNVILNANDTIQPVAFNSSGVALTVDTNASFTLLRIH